MNHQELPSAARQFIDATNSEDREALLGAFTATATVDDFGRLFSGHVEIGTWSDQENIGSHNRIQIHRVTRNRGVVLTDISVTGSGYNGPGTFEFHLDGNLIQRMIIRG